MATVGDAPYVVTNDSTNTDIYFIHADGIVYTVHFSTQKALPADAPTSVKQKMATYIDANQTGSSVDTVANTGFSGGTPSLSGDYVYFYAINHGMPNPIESDPAEKNGTGNGLPGFLNTPEDQLVNGGENLIGGITALETDAEHLISDITSGAFWLRVAEFAGGILLVGIGAKSLFNVSVPNTAKKIVKGIPGNLALKKAV